MAIAFEMWRRAPSAMVFHRSASAAREVLPGLTCTLSVTRGCNALASRCGGCRAAPQPGEGCCSRTLPLDEADLRHVYDHLLPFAGTYNWSGPSITDSNDHGLAVAAAVEQARAALVLGEEIGSDGPFGLVRSCRELLDDLERLRRS